MTIDPGDPAFVALKTALAITPKTTTSLMQLGFTSYHELAVLSPNELLARLSTLSSIKSSGVECYRRAARRMVWLGTQDDPQAEAERFKDWTVKALKARGIWNDGFDNLSGNEIEERYGYALKHG